MDVRHVDGGRGPRRLRLSVCRARGAGRLPGGGGGREVPRGELADDGDDEGVGDGAAADGGGEDGHGLLRGQRRGLRQRRGAVRSAWYAVACSRWISEGFMTVGTLPPRRSGSQAAGRRLAPVEPALRG